MEIKSKYKASIEFLKVGSINKELELNIPISLDFKDIYKIMDLLELEDIMSYLVENYHLIEIQKKIDEIKELDNE